jgi:hypothetical protein
MALTYLPTFLRAAANSSNKTQMTLADVPGANLLSTSSFSYDVASSPLKSTQQLNVDWSRFENHTFFSSAEANVNIAFDQIINNYPFDGTKLDFEKFFENLTGFEKWVFDQMPKYRGALRFDQGVGSFISVKDSAGALYPELSRDRSGTSIITPMDGESLTIEMQIKVPSGSNDNQVVCQKIDSNGQGFSLHLSQSSSSTTCNIEFVVSSGSTYLFAAAPLTKGEYRHVCAVLDRETSPHVIEIYIDEMLSARSQASAYINGFTNSAENFNIGSGSAVSYGPNTFSPVLTLSASIDELRVFHAVRTIEQQRQYAKRSLFSTDALKLYYRFNEPRPLLGAALSDDINSIVLDSSGNALHSLITAFTGTLREEFDSSNPMIYERLETCPILFPAHEEVLGWNQTLLLSASLYDAANPNLITRLIPQHYLIAGGEQDGLTTEEGTIGNSYGGAGMPGSGEKGSIQAIVTFLYVWAKFFDEVKLYIDSFSNVNHVDYEQNDTAPDNFLGRLVRMYGFTMPPLFTNSTIDQYYDGNNVNEEADTATYPLKYVQEQLLRRVLINMPDVIRSKGTQHSIKAFLRAIGIDPDNSLRIREYGGPTERNLSYSREAKRETTYLAEFGTGSYAFSPVLSASRVEPGYPRTVGDFVLSNVYTPHGISNNANDGLLTSGSWTVEGMVKFPLVSDRGGSQSLVRMCVSGSRASGGNTIAFNLLAVSSSTQPKLVLWACPDSGSTAPVLSLTLNLTTASHVFDADVWNFSFGRQRADEIESSLSSSYFLRAAKQQNGEVVAWYSTSSFFYENYSGLANVLNSKSSTTGSVSSGVFLAFGANQTIGSGNVSEYPLLNNSNISSDARTTSFDGRLGQIRFWSKALTHDEWREHVRNFKSVGVKNPLLNYNYADTSTGSFERLRLDVFGKQSERDTITGEFTFYDLSENLNHVIGTGFSSGSVLKGEVLEYSYLSPYFDEAVSSDKIRIRGLENYSADSPPWTTIAPAHEILKSEQPTDDVRFTIDFSLVDALNRDIVTMFSTFDALDNALGDPSLAFSPDYPDFERLRDIYFNKLSEKLNFKQFFDFFKWFDSTVGTFISQLIPRKTRFSGVNFSVESHMLERHKIEYKYGDQYLGDTERPINNVLLLQLIAGSIRKF